MKKKCELELVRKYFKRGYTIGTLLVDGVYECDTLEPQWRDYANGEEKVKGKSAIPAGRYKIHMRSDGRHGFTVPQLNDVPMFSGIQIHPGNTADDTAGCILVGENKRVGKVINSISRFSKLMQKLLDCYCQCREIWITIRDERKNN